MPISETITLKLFGRCFSVTVTLAKNFEMIGGKLLADDSAKLRAQNSEKNNFNPAKIERHIAYVNETVTIRPTCPA